MRKVKLYIAASLDGMVAEADGSVAFLDDIPHPEGEDYGYYAFIEGIDTTLMGNTTYQQVLGFDVPFPYSDLTNYVFTRNTALDKDEHVTFVSEDIAQFVQDLKQQEGKDIWLIGGGQVNSLMLNHHLVDELIISVMPVILGSGLPLFENIAETHSVTLIDNQSYTSGVVKLTYSLKPKS